MKRPASESQTFLTKICCTSRREIAESQVKEACIVHISDTHIFTAGTGGRRHSSSAAQEGADTQVSDTPPPPPAQEGAFLPICESLAGELYTVVERMITSSSPADRFPPIEVVSHNGQLYSFPDRRLFASRVLSHWGRAFRDGRLILTTLRELVDGRLRSRFYDEGVDGWRYTTVGWRA